MKVSKTKSVDWREILKKILRTLKSVLLSIFHMDYQTGSQKENERQKRKASKAKPAFVILSTVTIMWAILYFATPWKYVILGIILFAGWLGLVVIAIDEGLKRKKPAVSPLEARHRLALSEGQKENEKVVREGKINANQP